MEYLFDPDWFANQVAENLKKGYDVKLAIFFAIIHYPPMIDAILRGIELGSKHD